MANNLLETVRDPGFRGDLGRPEQKEPAGGWQNWLAAVTSKANDYRDDYLSSIAPANKRRTD